MKQAAVVAIFCMLALDATALSAHNSMAKDKTITQVVKLLEGMLETSKKEGDKERTAYALYVCDCDKRSTEYKATIASSEETITLLANQIAGLKAANAKLSEECASLKASMAENEAAQKAATALRNKQNAAFEAEKTDLEEAIKQLTAAIATLAEVSADQTAEDATGMDHTKFMSGYKPKYSSVSLLKAKSSLKQALAAASVFMDDKKAKTVASFMQAPFTGTYTSQSVEVMGILKDMKDTFESNLEAAIAKEAKEKAAYDEFMDLKKEEYDTMEKSYNKKQGELADNDASLSAKKKQKKATEENMAEAQQFLAETEKMCAEKKAEYSKRRMLQVEEEAAIAEAIAILNSDEAFATFGTVSATSTGKLGFLQLKSIQKHTMEDEGLRSQLVKTLQKVKGSKRMSKLVSLVKATNVFAVVLEEIDKMLALIAEEAKTDKTNLDFCNSERTKNDKLIADKTSAINDLTLAIEQLDTDINDPEKGLKKQIADTEESLLQNAADQKKATEERAKEHALYQEDIKNLDDAEEILNKAISVLSAYYAKLDAALAGASLMQKHGAKRNTPVPTEDTAVLKMKGESESGKGVITKLQYILSETEAEEKEANEEEKKSQQEYEDTMTGLKTQETTLQGNLASLQGKLAAAEKEMLAKQKELKTTEEEKAAAEAYLAEIKPGCDFITHNFDLREKNRLEETTQLKKAIELVKGTPEYKNYEAAAHLESLGDCQKACKAGEEKVECLACLADVTIPAYCAGHAGTPGCDEKA